MEIVAQHLQQTALARSSPVERDLFGRSAFNRYYYAMFLEVKAGLATLSPDWAGDLAHAAIPGLLRGKVTKRLKEGRSKAQRFGDADLVSTCGSALTATVELARLMDEGRATRVAADYHPHVLIDFSPHNDFLLNTVGVQTAKSWPFRARTFLNRISAAWKQLYA